MDVERKLNESGLKYGGSNGSPKRARRPEVGRKVCLKVMKECAEGYKEEWEDTGLYQRPGQVIMPGGLTNASGSLGPHFAPCSSIVTFRLADGDWVVDPCSMNLKTGAKLDCV